MRIQRHKYAQRTLILFALFAVIFLTVFAYFLGFGFVFDSKEFFIVLIAITCEIVVFLFLYIILRICTKSHFLISPDGIKLFKKDEEFFDLKTMKIIRIWYVRFRWALLLQIGAGYLHVEFEGESEKIQPIMSFPDGRKTLHISMSKKQAKQVALILDRDLQIK